MAHYPVPSEAHAECGIVFEPNVWRPSEVQAILVDMVLHEAYVRGNSWSSCHQLLYAIRHLNVRKLDRCSKKQAEALADHGRPEEDQR